MTIGVHDDVSDVSGVARCTVDHPTVDHHATTHSGADHHAEIVRMTLGGSEPPFGESESFGVEITMHRHVHDGGDRLAQRETSPRRNVQRRHGGAVGFDRTR